MLTLGLFERQIQGDDALWELARLRFSQAGMGAEMHAGTPEELERVMAFRPSPPRRAEGRAEPGSVALPVTLHLARGFVLPEAQPQILAFANRFAGRVYGMVLHDHPELASRPAQYLEAVRQLDSGLAKIEGRPWVFIEYAAGLDPALYRAFIESTRGLRNISACVDVGHVGIWRARQAFAERHPGVDVCVLKGDPARVPALMADIDAAVAESLPTVLGLIESLSSLGKPVHFHLHDGHPLSAFSPYGVADHLSFLAEVPLDFEHRGRRSAALMFGPEGLARIAREALKAVGREQASFTLEIHPAFGRRPLDAEAATFFGHWVDKTNAEKMNAWLGMLAGNHELLVRALLAARETGCCPTAY